MVPGVTVGLAGIAFGDWLGELASGGVMGAVVLGGWSLCKGVLG